MTGGLQAFAVLHECGGAAAAAARPARSRRSGPRQQPQWRRDKASSSRSASRAGLPHTITGHRPWSRAGSRAHTWRQPINIKVNINGVVELVEHTAAAATAAAAAAWLNHKLV
ncbi:hypothetical protein HYH02_007771 [Chlamydomonas schloesseri]|uniref:Uncharacterized protein n=1 Tax=Chlamydomonas schloesseri TaxID=2026947 RepID=A0A835WHD2_9CHLO|nr:hypothetical protein HYH02_007771 [Chlamydomonas schloesseri]|eukprot:KAG2447446.1 hypothetical protein HYH02_007771 [Chlamydomonas schloesseri]